MKQPIYHSVEYAENSRGEGQKKNLKVFTEFKAKCLTIQNFPEFYKKEVFTKFKDENSTDSPASRKKIFAYFRPGTFDRMQ